MQAKTSATIYKKFNSLTNDAHLTEHGRRRMGQRGVRPEAVELVLKLGRKIYSRRALFFVIGHKEITKYGDQYPQLKQLEGLQVVTDAGSNDILTVYRNQNLRQIRPDKRKHCHLH